LLGTSACNTKPRGTSAPHPQGYAGTQHDSLGGQGQIVEIDETFLGGRKLRKGVKAGKDAKISVLGMV